MSFSTTQVKDSNSLPGGDSTSRLVLQMARRDISTLFRTPWIIISRSLAFIVQLFVFAYLISGFVVKFPNYFEYYAVGSVVGTIASISFIIGYNMFDVTLALLELAVSRASTALYPLAFMPSYVAAFAPYSPVTFAADSMRDVLEGTSLNFLSIAGLLAFVTIFVGVGATFYFRRLEGGVYA